MSMKNNLKEKMLNKSDMYNFYKEGYEQYKTSYEHLLETMKNSKPQDNIALNKRSNDKFKELLIHQKELDDENNHLKKLLNDNNDTLMGKETNLNKFIKELDEKNTEINTLNYNLDEKNIEIDALNCDLDEKNTEINNLNTNLNQKNTEINNLNTNLNQKNTEINKLSNIINSKNEEIKKLNFPYRNFDEYLAESYVFPLVWSPFSEESKRCFAFMEEIASYFVSKAEQSNQPLISVIMPVYNRKDVVMKAIESVLNQTYKNFELIVIDDASTDGTTQLLKELKHEKIKVVFHEKNKYASGARNTGLKESKGEFIAYLDSDNLLDERYLAATVGAFLEFPDAGGIYSAQYRYETYDSKPFAVQFAPLNKSLLHNHNFIDMNCFAHRRSVYENLGGFDETLKGADDWELILRISNYSKIYSVPFLLSKCYVGVVENRVSDLVPTDMKKIRSQNEVLPTKKSILKKKLNIIIPIFDSTSNLIECINTIISLDLSNLKIIISNNHSSIDLTNQINELNNKNITLIQTNSNTGFTNAINEGIKNSDPFSDILLLSKDALLTEGSLESLQKHAYELKDCGLVVSQQVLPNGKLIQHHIPYGHPDYWCDITPSKYRKNIINVPLFHNGEFLELNSTPFFCTYIKRDILNEYGELNPTLGNHYHSLRLLSDYVRHIMKLKIYHISEAVVIYNLEEEYRNNNPINNYDYTFKDNIIENTPNKEPYKKYVWDF